MVNQITSYQTAEYGKFLKLEENSLFPPVSVVRLSYPDTTNAFPENENAKPLSSVDVYPKYAVLTHIVNPEDIKVSLSAGEITVELENLETIMTGVSTEIVSLKQYIDDLESNTFDTASACDDVYRELIEINSNIKALSSIDVVDILNTVAVSGNVTITNPTTAVTITETVTAIIISQEPVALKDINNNNVTVNSSTSSLNVNVTNPIIATVDPSSAFFVSFTHTPNFDAFNRMRVSNPLTLFDSSHRYRDNNLWSSLTAVNGTYAFNQNQGLVEMTVNNLSGSSVIRETTKTFSYQSGKSLLVMNTFVMAPSATNLRQRVGYFGQDNGIYVQLDDDTISFVERSLVNGSPSSETIVPLSDWNGDKLDGSGSSGLKIDITKAQIFWMDIEWLGVGTVRCGFIINGVFILCHSFHHANLIPSTYITTASLPLRYEIVNKDNTNGSHTLKQVCSTVISEGGYELRGLQQAVSIPINAPITFASANVFYPIISLKLKTSPNRLDAIVILTALSLLGDGDGKKYNWRVVASGTTAGGTWVDAGPDSSVEYNITGTSFSGGRILASGFLSSNNQSSPSVDILKEALFSFQLERNSFTKTPYELTLIAAVNSSSGTTGLLASMDWEEISR